MAGLLLVHLVWHAGSSLVLLLRLLHVGAWTAVELLSLCVSHIWRSTRHFRDASSVLLGWTWAEAAGWGTTVHRGLDWRRRHAGLIRHGVLIRCGASVVVNGVEIGIFSMCTGWRNAYVAGRIPVADCGGRGGGRIVASVAALCGGTSLWGVHLERLLWMFLEMAKVLLEHAQ